MGSGIKVPVLVRPNEYTIYFEGLQMPDGIRLTFVHCDVHKWTKRIAQQLKQDFAGLVRSRTGKPLYCLRHDNKQEKFIRMFGFKYEFDPNVWILET